MCIIFDSLIRHIADKKIVCCTEFAADSVKEGGFLLKDTPAGIQKLTKHDTFPVE